MLDLIEKYVISFLAGVLSLVFFLLLLLLFCCCLDGLFLKLVQVGFCKEGHLAYVTSVQS